MITEENRAISGRQRVAKPGIQAPRATEDAGAFGVLFGEMKD